MSDASDALRVTVWNEFVHEQDNDVVAGLYPQGIHTTIADGLNASFSSRGIHASVQTATLDQPEHGLTEERLNETDVLFWWGHRAHDQVADAIVDRVQTRVLQGMGLVVLHSGHASKIFRRLMGTGCMLRWRVADERERLWIVNPGHPIVAGIEEDYWELPAAEMYGEFFDIPTPDELVFISWFQGGEVFRSGCTFRRGHGKIFYFRPGHETYPIYHDKTVNRVLANAAQWAGSSGTKSNYVAEARNAEPLEPLEPHS